MDELSKQLSAVAVEQIVQCRGPTLLTTADHAKEVIADIEAAAQLNGLSFVGFSVGVEAGAAIAAVLQRHPELRRALWSDMFKSRLLTEIPLTLRGLLDGVAASGARLTELDLSDNAFGKVGAQAIEHFLRSPSAYSLRTLKLNNCGLGAGGLVIAEALTDGLERSVADGTRLSLCTFEAGRNRLENPGAVALVHAFSRLASLEEISLPQNGIYHKGIAALARSLPRNRRLRHLNLQDNTFTEKGANEIAKRLPCLQQLELVNFGDCLCKNSGCLNIVSALKPIQTLKVLKLDGNGVGSETCMLLLNLMKGNKSLKQFTLCNNSLKENFAELKESARQMRFDVDFGNESDQASEDDDDDEEGEEESASDNGGDSDASSGADPAFSVTTQTSVDEFMDAPSLPLLHSLLPDPRTAIVDYLGDELDNAQAVVDALVKLCSVVTEENEEAAMSPLILCCAELLRAIAQKKQRPLSPESQVVNHLVARLGLIRADGAGDAPFNLYGVVCCVDELVTRGHFKKQHQVLHFWFSRSADSLQSVDKAIVGRLLENLAKTD